MLIVPKNDSQEFTRDKILQSIDQEWRAGIPPSPLWGALKNVAMVTEQRGYEKELESLVGSANDLSSLRIFLEKVVTGQPQMGLSVRSYKLLAQALARCETYNTHAEILALSRDAVARMKRLGLPADAHILNLGLFYAALDLSLPSMRYFARVWQSDLSQDSVQLAFIQALSTAIDAKLLQDPIYDLSLLRDEITGVGSVSGSIELHNLVCKSPQPDSYHHTSLLRLLAQIGSDEVLYDSFSEFLKMPFDSEDAELFCSAYDVAVTLVRYGHSDTALLFLKDLSKKFGGDLPHLELTHNVRDLFKDPTVSQSLADLVNGATCNKLSEEGFVSMEQRNETEEGKSQGVEEHVGVATSLWATITNQPFPNVDGDSTGYGDISQLYPQLKAHGRSKSRKELGRIIDLLNNYDGDLIDVTARPQISTFMRQHEGSRLDHTEFRWCPQPSAIDFSNESFEDDDMTEQSDRLSPASLGLMRARSWAHGVPQAGASTLHLLHLGYLEMRGDPDDPWQPSGYMVAWDRQFGDLVALYVGENSAVVAQGPTPAEAPFGALMNLWPSDGPAPHAVSVARERQARGVLGRYYVDIDPSPDLGA